MYIYSNFLSANVVENRKESQSSGGQKSQGKKTKKADKVAVVNEQKIDLFLDMIKGADVTSEDNKAENETLLELEGTLLSHDTVLCHTMHNQNLIL